MNPATRPAPTSGATPVSRATWREVLAADPEAVASQAPEWVDALAPRGYTDATRLYALPGGRRGVLPLVARRRLGVPVSEESWPYGWAYGGLLVEGGELTEADCRIVLSDLAQRPAVLRSVVPNPLQGKVWSAAADSLGLPLQRVRYRSQVVDLEPGFDEIWEKRYKRQARNSVRKAEKFELEVRREDGAAASLPGRGISIFADLYAQSVDRWAEHRGQPLVIARRLAAHRDRAGQVAAVAKALGENCVVWSVLQEGRPVAVNVVLQRGRHALGWMCAMDTELARTTLATYLLHSVAIKDACEHGVRWFHMGESDSGSGPEHFKAYFGAFPVDYEVLRFERLPLSRTEKGLRVAYGKAGEATSAAKAKVAELRARRAGGPAATPEVADEPAAGKPDRAEPAAEKPASVKSGAEKPAAVKPAAAKPAAARPSVVEPAAPAAEKPGSGS
ncbi:hypothetical protein GCM10009836_40800 [Pseudonocardia ailaonensis]|uniref:BioF2-like acetyltransferase domain-containing protein n=1 Tax=Pseudonocardia ailaonensis TaxID=367279 RepID=A0ABN2N7L0_9PSEU